MDRALAAFAGIAVVVVLMPGADTVLVLNASLRDGTRAGIVTATGVVCGPVLWGALAGLGAAVILGRNPLASALIAAAGGIYLCHLAIRSFAAARTSWRTAADIDTAPDDAPHGGTTVTHFLTGLTTNVLNPKIGVFYLSVMPALFIGRPVTVWLGALLGLIHATVGIVFLTGVSVMSGLARRRLSRPHNRAFLESICGLCLLGFGVFALGQASAAVAGAAPAREQSVVFGLDDRQAQRGTHLDPQPGDARRT